MKNEFNKIYQEILNESTEEQIENAGFDKDDVDGKDFGHPGKFYHVTIKGTIKITDDSDYRREVGYGPLKHRDIEDITVFTINEYDASGNILRTEEQIKSEDFELFSDLYLYAKEMAIDRNS